MQTGGRITPVDASKILLFVGFTEYGNALSNFTELLATSTSEELQAMDEIVGEREEFTVYSNLSQQISHGPSTLSERVSADETPEGRRGLAWIIALARVEFGAILAGFSDAPTPFAKVPLHAFDSDQYRQLLLDGSRTHYWALVNDPALKKVTSESPVNPIVLAYSRRLRIARAMLSAATRLGQRGYSDVQIRELSSWKESMDTVHAVLVANIELYLQQVTRVSSKVSKRQQDYTQACSALLRAEQQELARGTARTRTLP